MARLGGGSLASTSQTSSASVTVTTGAKIFRLAISGYGSAGVFSGTNPTLASAAPGVAVIADDNPPDTFMGAQYLWFDPPTGSQTLAWTWASAPSHGVTFGYDSYDDVMSATPKATAAVQSLSKPFSTGSLTAASGDVVLAAATQFDTASPSVWTWVNATERAELHNEGTAALSTADAYPSGNVTITAEETSFASDDGSILAIVLTPSGGGGSIVPVLMRQYRARRNYRKTPSGVWAPNYRVELARAA